MMDLGDIRLAGDPARRDLPKGNEIVKQRDGSVLGAEGSPGLRSSPEFSLQIS
jgi:hypothetical protein